jgi:hypothetical protein
LTLLYEELLSDSPYIDAVIHGQTVGEGSAIRPAETHWHMVFVNHEGDRRALLVGPWTQSGVVSYGGSAEILWIKFKLGVWFSHLPVREFVDRETVLPEAAGQSFWLKSAAWEFPAPETVEIFVERLARQEILVGDPVVQTVLEGQQPSLSPRTVRHRFLHSTGMTQNHIYQVERAQQAAALLRQGVSILDTIEQSGYFDQPHLTRSLKQWIGYTPAQLMRRIQSE